MAEIHLTATIMDVEAHGTDVPMSRRSPTWTHQE